MKIPSLLLLPFSLTLAACGNDPGAPGPGMEGPSDTLAVQTDERPPFPGFLKTYEGRIGEDKEIEMVLTNWGDGFLSGNYWEKNNKKPVELSGELIDGGKFQLIAGDYKNETGTFSGYLDNTTVIKGTWADPTLTTTAPFELNEVTSPADTTGWSGSWYLNEVWDNGSLFIGNVTYHSLDFALTISRSGHNGAIEGKAKIKGQQAFFQKKEFDVKPCVLKFVQKGGHVIVEQSSSNLACGFGARAYANGQYNRKFVRQKALLKIGPTEDDVFTDKATHDAFKALVGDAAYDLFAFNMLQSERNRANPGEFQNGTIVIGYVPGFYGSNEAIIIYDLQGKFWAAVIDQDRAKNEPLVRYFTNDETFKAQLPVAIETWREGFKSYRVIYQATKTAGNDNLAK